MNDVEPSAAPPPRTPPTLWERLGEARYLLLATSVCTALAFLGLTNHAFWDDEANTAIFARNLLTKGELTGWDGRNLIGFRAGAELDERLRNVYMPPLQYAVAALGFAALGETTLAGRLPFVLAGIACLIFTALLARRLLGGHPGWSLPAVLLSLSPAYLLYIRNCRYYSLGALLTVMTLWVAVAPLTTRRRQISAAVVGAIAAAALVFSHYLNAAAALVALPLLLLLPEHRTKRRAAHLGAIATGAVLSGAYILATANPFDSQVQAVDETPPLIRFATLLAWHVRDLAVFEFIPVLLIPALAIPFIGTASSRERTADLRPLVLRATLLLGMILAGTVVTAGFSPQPLDQANVADMRHQVPAIALAAIVSAVALSAIWRLSQTAAVIVGLLTVLTNLPTLGFLGQPSGMLPPRPVSCTLCDYIYEQTHDYETSNDTLVAHLETIPDDAIVLIYPAFMAYPSMFYHPQLRFACQLTADKHLAPYLQRRLPNYLFWARAKPDVGLISAPPPHTPSGPLHITYEDQRYYLGEYVMTGRLDVLAEDRSRPEIPWHSFSPREWEDIPKPGFFTVSITHP